MKKLSKLNINSEKTIKNDELLTLRGGYTCTCTCSDGYHMAASSEADCHTSCEAYGQLGVWKCC